MLVLYILCVYYSTAETLTKSVLANLPLFRVPRRVDAI